MVIAPCGFTVERSLQEIDRLTSRPGWSELTAVKNEEVYVADSNYFTRPSTTLVDGIELLASLFHPHLFQQVYFRYFSLTLSAYDFEKKQGTRFPCSFFLALYERTGLFGTKTKVSPYREGGKSHEVLLQERK